MVAISPNQWTILETLKNGPVWLRSLQTVKPLVDDLIQCGLIERCKPHLGRGANMVRLTADGCAALEIGTDAVPLVRTCSLKTGRPPQSQKTNRNLEAETLLGEIERWCRRTGTAETVIGHALFLHPGFVGLMRKRLTVTPEKEEAARTFLAEHPDGWRGELPLTHANGTRPVCSSPNASERIAGAGMSATIAPDRLLPRVDRDPCPRCGVRADVGCRHAANQAA